MPRLLTESKRRRFSDTGVVYPVRVLSDAETDHYRAACNLLEQQLGGKPRTIEVRQMHLHFRWAYSLASHPCILDAVEDLLGPDVLVWATELFIKHPGDASVAVGWHRDRPYLGFAGGKSVTAWVALNDSTSANGCMRVLPRNADHDESIAASDDRRLVDVELSAGETSLHDADVLHGSAPNLSQTKRIGFVIRYVTPDARPRTGRTPAVLVRGTDVYGNFALAQAPLEPDDDVALARMRQSAAQHLDAMLDNLRGMKKGHGAKTARPPASQGRE